MARDSASLNPEERWSMSVETWSERGSESARAPSREPASARLRPRLGPGEVLLQLWRSKGLMLLVFLPIVLLAAAAAMMLETKYTAATRLLVTLGSEYVFDPVVGEAGKGAFPQPEEVLQAESELAASPAIAERVIKQVGLVRLYPKIAQAEARDPARAHALDQGALEAFGKDFHALTTPKSSILKLTFAHPDPELAAETLNAFVKVYIDYRREVLDRRGVDGLGQQRAAIEGRLKAADDGLQAFLIANGVADFNSEKDSVTKLYGSLSDELSADQASLREAESRINGLGRELASTPRQQDLYVETTAGQEIANLKLEREKLLATYKPQSQAVQDVERKIKQLETFTAASPAQGVTRVGPNPTYQAMETDLASARATVEALKGKAVELERQRAAAEKRRTELAAMEPEFQRLSRDRDALETSAQTLAGREQSERLRADLSAQSASNISVYEPAEAPAKGSSPKRLVLIGGSAFAVLCALMAGLMRALSLRTLPTRASLERTLGLRALASAAER